MANDIDTRIGSRIRRRRLLLGLTQQQVGDPIGIRFQQIQKYECGANRVTAARLYQLSLVLGVPTTYFFGGLQKPMASNESENVRRVTEEVIDREETIELIRAYCILDERSRRSLLAFAKALQTRSAA